MEKTYLDREELINNRPEMRNPDQIGFDDYNAGWNACVSRFLDTIIKQPAADVAPVKHGAWIHGEYEIAHCSECGDETPEQYITLYCGSCGARMDGEESEVYQNE